MVAIDCNKFGPEAPKRLVLSGWSEKFKESATYV